MTPVQFTSCWIISKATVHVSRMKIKKILSWFGYRSVSMRWTRFMLLWKRNVSFNHCTVWQDVSQGLNSLGQAGIQTIAFIFSLVVLPWRFSKNDVSDAESLLSEGLDPFRKGSGLKYHWLAVWYLPQWNEAFFDNFHCRNGLFLFKLVFKANMFKWDNIKVNTLESFRSEKRLLYVVHMRWALDQHLAPVGFGRVCLLFNAALVLALLASFRTSVSCCCPSLMHLCERVVDTAASQSLSSFPLLLTASHFHRGSGVFLLSNLFWPCLQPGKNIDLKFAIQIALLCITMSG